MATAMKSSEAQPISSLQPCRPLDESVWKAWLSKNRAEEMRDSAARMRVLKFVALLLVVAAGVLALLGPSGIADVLVAMLAVPGMMAAGRVSARAA